MNLTESTLMDRKGYKLTRQQLLQDLYVAFFDARQNKAKMSYVKQFEKQLKQNLDELCDDLLTRRYTARPSKCFRHRLPQEARGFCSDVPRPRGASSVFQLYARAL